MEIYLRKGRKCHRERRSKKKREKQKRSHQVRGGGPPQNRHHQTLKVLQLLLSASASSSLLSCVVHGGATLVQVHPWKDCSLWVDPQQSRYFPEGTVALRGAMLEQVPHRRYRSLWRTHVKAKENSKEEGAAERNNHNPALMNPESHTEGIKCNLQQYQGGRSAWSEAEHQKGGEKVFSLSV